MLEMLYWRLEIRKQDFRKKLSERKIIIGKGVIPPLPP
jgi:hypothetical protein